jgi:hypothetical protein
VGPRAGLGIASASNRIPAPSYPARSQVAIPTELSQLPLCNIYLTTTSFSEPRLLEMHRIFLVWGEAPRYKRNNTRNRKTSKTP